MSLALPLAQLWVGLCSDSLVGCLIAAERRGDCRQGRRRRGIAVVLAGGQLTACRLLLPACWHSACAMSHVQGQLFMFACAVVQYQSVRPRDTPCMGGEEFLVWCVSHTGIGTGTKAGVLIDRHTLPCQQRPATAEGILGCVQADCRSVGLLRQDRVALGPRLPQTLLCATLRDALLFVTSNKRPPASWRQRGWVCSAAHITSRAQSAPLVEAQCAFWGTSLARWWCGAIPQGYLRGGKVVLVQQVLLWPDCPAICSTH